ncbi:serine hydrolase domain-containing protein [Ekhidna sp.]|uniref:serine hydrolase domain-containing protein n=1 Tax=Ekhidna sp. TaxID=2608089 RepID=UPI003CCB7817
MRSRLFIGLMCVCTAILASDNETREEVWIDGDSFYKSVRHKKKSTIYFGEWSSYAAQFLEDKNYYVALQLDDRFDPLPKDDVILPSLATIAAISDPSLRKDYYHFLESFGRTKGVNHMVLPDTSAYTDFEKEVILELNQHSPFYFIDKSILSYSLPDSRKEFETEAKVQPTIWVASQDANTKKLSRWGEKMDKDELDAFYTRIKQSKQTAFFPVYDLPGSLAEKMFAESVLAFDPDSVFPLQVDRITYLGLDLQLRNRLKQYVEVLDYRVPGVPCIVDKRNTNTKLYDHDILIQKGVGNKDHSALVLPEFTIEEPDVLIAQMLFGAHQIVGRSNHMHINPIKNPAYLGFSDLEREGLSKEKLIWIDSLATLAINRFATPGMQVAVVKNGQMVLEKSYGFFTYDSLIPVTRNTVYDIASITKVAATLPAIALLIDQNKIQLDDSLSQHLEAFNESNKGQITIRQLLAHNGGLRSYVPFWSMMMDGDRLDAFYYKTSEDEARDIRTYGLEPHPSMLDSLKSFIVRSELIKNPENYNYSDLGFMILHLLVEEVSGLSFDAFVTQNFYDPMGMKRTTFLPIKNGISPKEIAPTEYDNRYRNYQVWGEVHDRNALVFGGVAGHAGLFSTARDLAKLMYMFLNDGYYGGRQYLSPETLSHLNARYFENNRRGLGWDKKDGEKDAAASLASDRSFGHTGFTGTMVWADPDQDLIYVFLSNRIYPDANNWRLGQLNIRTQMHDVIYKSLKNVN